MVEQKVLRSLSYDALSAIHNAAQASPTAAAASLDSSSILPFRALEFRQVPAASELPQAAPPAYVQLTPSFG
jgi:hypothetical protein